MRAASYRGLKPASSRASAAARGSSQKRDTLPERILRRELFRLRLRYRIDAASLTGRPDIVFLGPRVAVFVDGDFWHGRRLRSRAKALERGHNPSYWVAKIAGNVARDRAARARLSRLGWAVVRVWEGDVKRDAEKEARRVLNAVRRRTRASSMRS